MFKKCSKCKKEKLISEFYLDKHSKTKLTAKCIDCYKRHYIDNVEKYQEFRNKNRERLNKESARIRRGWKDDWTAYFINTYGENPSCQICEKGLTWIRGNINQTVHFDHRHGGNEQISCTPSKWFERRPPTLENRKIFELCDFGILCNKCNRFLPTINCQEWLVKVCRYTGAHTGCI